MTIPTYELTDEQRESLERGTATVLGLDDAARQAILEHAIKATIRYATEAHSADVLHNWALGLLTTLRVHARGAAYGQYLTPPG